MGFIHRCIKRVDMRVTHKSSLSALLQLGGGCKPMRIRVLDLPFTAVEWVVPNEATRNVRPDSWMVSLLHCSYFVVTINEAHLLSAESHALP